MAETELKPGIMVYYIDNKTGQTYVEIGGRVFELEIGDDVTEEVVYRELEAMMVFDPESVDEEPGVLRIHSAG